MSKRKAPKFNTVLEDFRKFIGESKEAEESQGKSESSVALGKSDSEVVEELPGGGKTKGGPSEPVSNKGVDATQKLPGTSEPSKEEPSRKECAPSAKVAEEGTPSELVNRLLSNIKVAVQAIEEDEKKEATMAESKKELKGDQHKLDSDGDGKIEGEDLKKLREEKSTKSAEKLEEESEEKSEEAAESSEENVENKKEENSEEDKEEEKEASDESTEEAKEEVKEEAKEASEDCQKPECGKCGSEKKETLEIDEDKLAEKIAAHYRNISVGYELGKFLFSSLGQKQAEAPVAPEAAAAPQSEIEMILQALQELVQSGEITEEQAQNVLMQLQASAEGGPAPEAAAEEPKMASDLFTEEQIKEIEASINAKVAEWVAEGKTDSEITSLIKEAAEFDAKQLVQVETQQSGKTATEAELIEGEIVKAVEAKVAELKEAGASEEQITQYLEQAAKADAQLLIKAAQQEKIVAEIMNKVAEKRQEKLANVSPEVQQILEALEALLQSGQISEDEAMMVLQELGLAGDQAAAAPAEAAPEAPAEKAEAPKAEDKKEDK